MYARKRIDIGSGDILRTLWDCVAAGRASTSRLELQRTLEQTWRADGTGLACLSVRSGFDLLLGCVEWPAGSQVLMSAVTMPDMARIVREHGYVPVPVDLDLERMKPVRSEVESAVTAKSRALVGAHLFGARPSLDSLAKLCGRHDLLLIEDCAQAYDGLGFTGHESADVSMFSFGTIKTATCAGGALLTVGDEQLRQAMRSKQAMQPLQSSITYAAKLLKLMGFLALQRPKVFGLFTRIVTSLGRDYDLVIRRMTKGFGDQDFLAAIRQQPCAPLLGCMLRRLGDSADRIAARSEAASRFYRQLSPTVARFGAHAQTHNHWIVPIMVSNRAEVIEALRSTGFDATAASSTLTVIEAPAGHVSPVRAQAAMDQIVYLPVYPEAGVEQHDLMARIVNATAKPAQLTVQPDEPDRAETPARLGSTELVN